MPKGFRLPEGVRFHAAGADDQTAQRELKAFRYVVESVNRDAQNVWTELWEELEAGVTPGGMVLAEMSQGFKPKCGWAEFLEKFWLLKHYLDYIHRLAKQQPEEKKPPQAE
jgi:hypothetical protein